MGKVFHAISILFLATSSLTSQGLEMEHMTKWDELKYDVGSMFGGMGYTYSRPLHWSNKQFGDFAIVVAGLGLTSLIDEEARDVFLDQEEDIPEFILDYGETYGGPSLNFMLTGAVYFTGFLANKPKLKELGVKLVSSAATAGFLQQVTKYAFGRARPFTEQGRYHFQPIESLRDYHSFPSGHTMLAFTNAYIIAKEFKSPWIRAGIYTVGAIPGITRLWEDQHWLTDVGMGFLISILTVESVEKYMDMRYNNESKPSGKEVDWSLNFSPTGIGISCQF